MSTSNLPATGDVVANRYRLGEEIGSGGFGVIFKARQTRKPHRVALKVMTYSGAPVGPEEMKRRFRREAVMASNLIHPHAVRQFDFGEDGDLFYLAMELLDGETLGERIERQGALSVELVLRVARATLEVLELAHQKDIVHRDLKPHNIMLCRVDGQEDFPKVLDFGAAKTTHGQHDLTSAGIALGSPDYMAPEILMDRDPLPASDIYSLAITLGEALVGEKIVAGDDPIDRARNQLSPEPLKLPPSLLSSPIYPWLSRALEKDLARRYASARQMLQDLQKLERQLGLLPRSATQSTPAVDRDFSAESTVLIAADDIPMNPPAPSSYTLTDHDTSPTLPSFSPPTQESEALVAPPDDDAPTAVIENPLQQLRARSSSAEHFPSAPDPQPTPAPLTSSDKDAPLTGADALPGQSTPPQQRAVADHRQPPSDLSAAEGQGPPLEPTEDGDGDEHRLASLLPVDLPFNMPVVALVAASLVLLVLLILIGLMIIAAVAR